MIDALLMQGIGSEYVLADMDSLDPTNLNRIRSSYDQLGVHKVDIVAKKISELDPFIEQTHLKNGLDESNLQEIIKRNKPNIIVDEMDSLRMKVILRLQAKKHGIPVLMATDNGDNILLDIERYDTDKNLPMLLEHRQDEKKLKKHNLKQPKQQSLDLKKKKEYLLDFLNSSVKQTVQL